MTSVVEILELLESDNSRLFKESVLKSNVSNELLKRCFALTLDPWKNWGISKYDKPKSIGEGGHSDELLSLFLDCLESLNNREYTGNAARAAAERWIHSGDELAQKWFERILWRNLRCGVSSTLVNKFWPNTVVPFAVALADTLETEYKNGNFKIIEDVKYPVRVEAKLDGLRVIAVKESGVVTFYTRNGTVLDTLPTLKSSLESISQDDIVFDGEVMGRDWNDSASVLMSSKKKKDDADMLYHIFDVVPLESWKTQKCDMTYRERLDLLVSSLENYMDDSKFRLVKNKDCENEKEIQDFYLECLEDGYEGVMLKSYDSAYQWKRSKSILKLKPVTTHEGVIVGWYNSKESTKRAGQFGGFNVLLPNGVTTRVGGGYTDEIKRTVQSEGPDSYIGKIVECEAQLLTPDGCMRFPVFSRFREESDVDPKIIEAYHLWKETSK